MTDCEITVLVLGIMITVVFFTLVGYMLYLEFDLHLPKLCKKCFGWSSQKKDFTKTCKCTTEKSKQN